MVLKAIRRNKMISKKFMRLKVIVWMLLPFTLCKAQQRDSVWTATDTLTAMVSAYETNRPARTIPAAISVIEPADIHRFTSASLVSVMNMQPGVRMEERSPGSYRLSIRGSSLRSPFGIRNVKFYLNDVPFTDPGGNTYLNQLDLHNINSLEIIKGPASSLYGAGSGGAVLLHSMPAQFEKNATIELLGGSYGLASLHSAVNFGSENARNKIQYTHQQSDGWRDHTNMRRDIATYENNLRISNKQILQTILLFGDLYYQTPGALTLAQYKANPRSARGAAGPFPSATTAKAAIYQQYFLAGITNTYAIKKNWKNTTAVYGAGSWFNNPTFRLYEKRTEPHAGGRTFFTNDIHAGNSLLHVVYGAEAQKGIFSSQTFKNKNGTPDTIKTNDEINNWRYSVFTQAEWLINSSWNITAGISYNKSHAGIERLLVYPVTNLQRTFNSELAPRVAIMKTFKQLNIYGTVSKGFSPPTTAELLPGTGIINTTLKAEQGINYEAGLKASLLKQKLFFDVSVYHFFVNDAISQRRDASGGDYYVNAGKTKQNGIEFFTKYLLLRSTNNFIRNLVITGSYTGNFYEYDNYKVIAVDYSGNQLPGIPKHNLVFGLDASFKHGLYANLTYQSVDKIAMNDANSEYADAYHLLGAKLGWQITLKQKHMIDLFVAGDNLLDEIYSLGNDINAAAGRYYNAAPGRNFSAGISMKIAGKRSAELTAL
ncbi:TonB-dependent receptor PqqU [soil metagenome]